MKEKLILLVLCLFVTLTLKAQKLSDHAQISVITCAPGDLIYECFGHTALRIFDPENNIDFAYNYGIFDFDRPNFGLNFAKGNLEYKLGKGYYNSFIAMYIRDQRTITEQVLNVNQNEKQRIFDFLKWNELPENRYYMYDYFYDNCATRVMTVVEKNLDTPLVYKTNFEMTQEASIRDMIKLYAFNNEWSRLGIDLCLGGTIDKKIPDVIYNFLPDYYLLSLKSATKGDKPFVKSTKLVYNGIEREKSHFFEKPVFAFWLGSLLLLAIYFFNKNQKIHKYIDLALFTASAVLGLLMLALWFLTNHTATAWNFNLLWAMPLNLTIPFLKPDLKKRYLLIYSFLLGSLLLNWYWFMQDLNNALFPIIALMAYRAYFLGKR